jgi:steroid Delta-isomerase
MGQSEVASAVSSFYAALRANDVDAWVSLFAADATARDPVGTPPHRGHDGLRDFLSGVLRQFESFGLSEEEVFCVPGGAAVRWAGSGRGKSGKDVAFRGIDVISIDGEGRITSLDAYWDAAPVMEAISLPE